MRLGGGARLTAAGVALGAALVPSSCGDGQQPQSPIAAAVHELQDAFVAGDAAGVCARLTREAQGAAAGFAHGTGKGCERDVERAFRMIAKGGGWEVSERPRVTATRSEPRRGTATISIGDGYSTVVPFAKEGGAWKLDGFFGTRSDIARPAVRRSLAAPRSPAGAGAVAVTRRDGRPCPRLRRDSELDVTGGCRFYFYAEDAPLYVLTAFGPFKFGNCSIGYSVRVDADGRAWTEPISASNPARDNGCADVRSCLGPSRVPWSGSVALDGDDRLVHRMRMCLDTCVGVFAGDLVVEMHRGERGWRAEPPPAGGGLAGFWIGQGFTVRDVPRFAARRG